MNKISYHLNRGFLTSYRVDNYDVFSSLKLGYLTEFLIEEVELFSIERYINFAKAHSDYDSIASDMYLITKENNIITLENIIDHPVDDEDSVIHCYVHSDKCEFFKTTRQEFLKILERWKEVIIMNPLPNKIIFLEDDNGHLSIEIEN